MGTQLYIPSSNSIIHNTKVDFINRSIQETINIVQYDRNMPIIAVSLYKNGSIYSLPVGLTAKIRWAKRDRTFVYKDALGCNTERNIIFFDVDEQMTYFHGKLDPIIELVDLSGSTPTIAGSSPIPVIIERNPIQEDYIQSTSEYIDLMQAVADAQQAAQDAGDNYMDINYADLVALRDSNRLKKGAFYRIIDYETTTVQAETRSAGHLFDIIVQALDEKTLSENASATHMDQEGLTLYRWVSEEELNNSNPQYLLTEMKDVGIGDVVWGYQLIDDGDYFNTSSNYEDDVDNQKTINNVGEGYMTGELSPWFEHNQSDPAERFFYVDSVVIGGEDYFTNSKLEAWKLKYCLDNDTNRFAWADKVNGKGVIYRMIDEYENDLPYDFKNIQFKRYMINTYTKDTALEGKYYALKDNSGYKHPNNASVDEGDFIWAYTFTTEVTSDGSYIETTALNKYILVNDGGDPAYCAKNIFGNNNIHLYDSFGERNSYILGNNVIYSEIDLIDEENHTYSYPPNHNTIGNGFRSNTIGNEFHYNTIRNGFKFNTIRDYFRSNTIGNNFYNNTIGNIFSNNTIGNDFGYNTIGNSFGFNTIGNDFGSNDVGVNFVNNDIGNVFNFNTISNYFESNTVGNNVMYIQFSWNAAITNRIRYLHLKDGLKGASTANRLDLYYDGLYGREYPTTFEIIANDNIISSWEETPLTRVGKVKATKTTATWSDTIEIIKQDKLVAGDNITIDENTNVISASGGPFGVRIQLDSQGRIPPADLKYITENISNTFFVDMDYADNDMGNIRVRYGTQDIAYVEVATFIKIRVDEYGITITNLGNINTYTIDPQEEPEYIQFVGMESVVVTAVSTY